MSENEQKESALQRLKNGDLTYAEYQLEQIGNGIGPALTAFEQAAKNLSPK